MPTASREQWRLDACSSEPIRTPGSIQPHGVFLAIDLAGDAIRVVSENSLELLGFAPAELLSTPLSDILSADQHAALSSSDAGENSTRVEINGAAFDAIVQRDGPLAFVELEPWIDGPQVTSEAAAYAAIDRLAAATTTEALNQLAAVVFSELTGFDRVMVYQFLPDGHGEVVGEQRVPEMEAYRGLHFPASDIPVQARELYLTKLSRAIVCTDIAAVPLVASADDEPETLDLSRAELRSVSPFHLQFMRNMKQSSTVSFSLIFRGELIGMITCAHRTERLLPRVARRRLEVLANRVATQLGSMREVAALQNEVRRRDLSAQLIGKIVASDDIAGALLTGDFTILDVIKADVVVMRLDGKISATADAHDVTALDEVFAAALEADIDPETGSLCSEAIAEEFPTIAKAIPDVAGILLVPLGTEGDYVAMLRHEVFRTIDWLGDLTDANRLETLSPRLSFSAWRQSVTGRSLPWDDVAAEAVRLAADIEGALHRRRDSRLATLATNDPLTGLGNRRFLMEELERLGSRDSQISLIFIDLDEFKMINDTHGHESGDIVISEVGRRLREGSRADDEVVRLGGDEFIVVCAGTSISDAQLIGERLVLATRAPIQLSVGEVSVTASVGVAAFEPGVPASEMLVRADEAMYRAKNSGRDRISV